MIALRSLFGGFVLSLVFAGCMQGGPPVAPAGDASARTVAGSVQNWPGGTATVQPVVTDETGTTVLGRLDVTSAISADGSFDLQLPPAVPSEQLNSAELCPGAFQGSVSPESWGEFFAEMGVFNGDQYVGGLILATTPDVYFTPEVGDMLVYRLFLDRPVTVQGTCSEQGFRQEFDAAGESGWNFIVFEVLEIGADGAPSAVRLTTPDVVPAGVDWYFVDLQSTATANSSLAVPTLRDVAE